LIINDALAVDGYSKSVSKIYPTTIEKGTTNSTSGEYSLKTIRASRNATIRFLPGSRVNTTSLILCDKTGTVIFDDGSTLLPSATGKGNLTISACEVHWDGTVGYHPKLTITNASTLILGTTITGRTIKSIPLSGLLNVGSVILQNQSAITGRKDCRTSHEAVAVFLQLI